MGTKYIAFSKEPVSTLMIESESYYTVDPGFRTVRPFSKQRLVFPIYLRTTDQPCQHPKYFSFTIVKDKQAFEYCFEQTTWPKSQ